MSTANTNVLTSHDLVWISLKTHGYLDFSGALHTLKEYKDSWLFPNLKQWKYPTLLLTPTSLNSQIGTVEPLLNEVLRNWENWFVILKVRYIEKLDLTNLRKNNQNVLLYRGMVNSCCFVLSCFSLFFVVVVVVVFFFLVWRRATQHFRMETITVNI